METALASTWSVSDIEFVIDTKKEYLPYKRALDIVLGTLALLFISPLLIISAILIKIDSKGPIFFRQRRVGLNGKEFIIYKFRTMMNGAESITEYTMNKNGYAKEMKDGCVKYNFIKLKNDPRITKFGKFLRRSSIDELPQLINVLKGEMSLVGPRPLIPPLYVNYELIRDMRTLVIPGITGLWQIRDRSDCNGLVPMLEHDIDYIQNFCFSLDIKILLATIPVVLGGKGAY
jgi:lipopolysaccharide/colanic/teichoic acid biosynthesis glycosyltransferase